ncbi:conserved Plasmodium protein, unknown function [Plasmodium sp. gorilla clade G2]|uniref:conserved Plasmodium protein, unknown function n=1 Tax=Plasmodium sp. gorilla clade G2 TaxID=880535 RepID=UPI000D222896|nr:conserved Plasmodium protein, unknown function [Plasmodium sp. gorilla clade G2]SOV10484.1 conserved Plasmodium protein, unknown function [Plasmodium sp. gorilla clade G2]
MSFHMNVFEQIEIILEKCNNETFIRINTLIDHIIRNYTNENNKEINEKKKVNDNNKKKKKKKKENNTNTIRNYFNLVDKENNLNNNNNNDDVTNLEEENKNKGNILSLTNKNNNKTIINMFFFFGHFNIMIIIYYVIFKLKMFDKDLFINEKNSNSQKDHSHTTDSISDDPNKMGSDNNKNKKISMSHTTNNKEHYHRKCDMHDDEEEDNETIKSDSQLKDTYSDSNSKDIMMSLSPNKEDESMMSDNPNKDISSSDHNMNDSTNESTITSLSTSINNRNNNRKDKKKNNNNNNSNNINNSSSSNNNGVYHNVDNQKHNNKYNTYNNKEHIIYHNKCITHILCSQLMYLDMNSMNQAVQDIVKTNKCKLLRVIILESFDSLNEYYRKIILNKLNKCNVLIFIHSTHSLNDTLLHNCLYIRIPKPDKTLFNNHMLDFLKTNYKINNFNNQKKQYIINVLNYCNFDIPLILTLLYIIQLHKFPDIKKIIKLIINTNIKKLINVIHKCIISNNSFFVIRNILYNILYTYNFHLHHFLNTFCKKLVTYHKNDNNYKKDLYDLFSKYTYITSLHDMHICSLENLCSNIILLEKKYAKTFNQVDNNSEDTDDSSINIKLEK